MRSSLSFACVAVVAALAACAEAGGEVKGGELTDAGLVATNPPAFTPDTGAATLSTCAGSGTKWSDLYRDVFGPTGQPGSCTLQSNCHGSADAAGAKGGSGLKCFDEKGCRQSFLDTNIVSAADSAAPEKATLFLGLLRLKKPDGSIVGFMPQTPADFVFPDECLERMKTWIRDGVPDN